METPLSEQLRDALDEFQDAVEIRESHQYGYLLGHDANPEACYANILSLVEKIALEAQVQALEAADCWLRKERRENIAHRLVYGEENE